MWPFYGCVSFGGFADGRCGNCCWMEKQDCQWEDIKEVGSMDPDPWKAGRVEFDLGKPAVETQLAKWKTSPMLRYDLGEAVREQQTRYQARLAEGAARKGRK